VILGTAAYMSPEQAKGKPVDKRTDIFALGALFYEMLTGAKAFPGEDVSEVLAAVIKTEPDWDALSADIDARLRALLRGCLQKDKRVRRRDMGDVYVELEDVRVHPFEAVPVASEAVAQRPWGAAIATLLAAGIAAYLGWTLKPEPTHSPPVRFEVHLEGTQRIGHTGRRPLAGRSADRLHQRKSALPSRSKTPGGTPHQRERSESVLLAGRRMARLLVGRHASENLHAG